MPEIHEFTTDGALVFHSPLSTERADRLAGELAATEPKTVLDFGCGWGELLLRVLERAPGAHGIGRDIHGPDIARGRAEAERRGLADRVTFVEGPAAEQVDGADVVICSGASQAFGKILEAFAALRPFVNPGGRLLFADGFWDGDPTDEQLANMWAGITRDEQPHLVGLVEAAAAAGFRPFRVETATRGEWEEFESGYAAGAVNWLLANDDHPEAEDLRRSLDEHYSRWLRGTYDVFGYAYLTLGVPAR